MLSTETVLIKSKACEIDNYLSSQETHFQQFLEGLSDLTSDLLSCGKVLAKQLSVVLISLYFFCNRQRQINK